MKILSRLRLRTKLAMLMGLSALAVVAVSGISAARMHQRMIEDRVDKLHSLVLTVRGLAEYLEQQVQASQLTREQAFTEFRDQLHRVRYGGNDDYFLAQTYDGMAVMHGGDPKREGMPTT